MSVRQILIWPEDTLEDESVDVSPGEDYSTIVEDLIDTMEAYMGVGLSAPQIGINKRVIVIDKSTDSEMKDHLVMINPVIEDGLGETTSQEGCLSFPGHVFFKPRATNISVSYLDKNFEKQTINANDFLAIAIQHEVDHLDGDLLVETVNRKERRGIKKSLKKFKSKMGKKIASNSHELR